jgi:hypothetical protein
MKIWETRRALFKAAYYSQHSRVFVENFAAKLSTSPQLTLSEHASSSSRCQNIKSIVNTPSPYLKHTFWKKKEHFSDVDIQ